LQRLREKEKAIRARHFDIQEMKFTSGGAQANAAPLDSTHANHLTSMGSPSQPRRGRGNAVQGASLTNSMQPQNKAVSTHEEQEQRDDAQPEAVSISKHGRDDKQIDPQKDDHVALDPLMMFQRVVASARATIEQSRPGNADTHVNDFVQRVSVAQSSNSVLDAIAAKSGDLATIDALAALKAFAGFAKPKSPASGEVWADDPQVELLLRCVGESINSLTPRDLSDVLSAMARLGFETQWLQALLLRISKNARSFDERSIVTAMLAISSLQTMISVSTGLTEVLCIDSSSGCASTSGFFESSSIGSDLPLLCFR